MRLRWAIRILAVALLAINLALFFFGHQIMLLYVNAKGGCFPWSSKIVEYREGMTICPGQSAVMRLPVTGRDI